MAKTSIKKVANAEIRAAKKYLERRRITSDDVSPKKFAQLAKKLDKSFNETLKNSAEVIKRLPELPQIMDKANQALTYLASGQIPQNSNSYTALNTKKSEMTAFRNQSIIGLLILVIFGLLIF